MFYLKLQLQILGLDEESFQSPDVSENYHSMNNVEGAEAIVQLINVTVKVPRSDQELVKQMEDRA